jgi:hypothetical protein
MRVYGFRVRNKKLAIAGTFLLVSVGWVIFRAASLSDARAILAAMAGTHGIEPIQALPSLVSLRSVLVMTVAFALVFPSPKRWRWLNQPSLARAIALGFALFVCSLRFDQAAQFLYFQF